MAFNTVEALAVVSGSYSNAAAILLLAVAACCTLYLFVQPDSRQTAEDSTSSPDNSSSILLADHTTEIGDRGHQQRQQSGMAPGCVFAALPEHPGSADTSADSTGFIRGAVTHTPSTGGTGIPSPWRHEMSMLKRNMSAVEHQDQEVSDAITQTANRMLNLRYQPQDPASTPAPDSPDLDVEGSSSDVENLPAHIEGVGIENVPEYTAEGWSAEVDMGNAEQDLSDEEHPNLALSPSQQVLGTVLSPRTSNAVTTGLAEQSAVSQPRLSADGCQQPSMAHQENQYDVTVTPQRVLSGSVSPEHLAELAEKSSGLESVSRRWEAARSGVQAQQRTLVRSVMQLERSLMRGAAVREHQEAAEASASPASAAGVSDDVQEAIVASVDELVDQIHFAVGTVRQLAKRVYGPDVEIDIHGENWHYEARNVMKTAALMLDSDDRSTTIGSVGTPSPSGQSGAWRTSSPGVMQLTDTAQGHVARAVDALVAGGFQQDLSEMVAGGEFSDVAMATLQRLQAQLCKLHGVQVPVGSRPQAVSESTLSANATRRNIPAPLMLPQPGGAPTPAPTPVTGITLHQPSPVHCSDLLNRCEQFSNATSCREYVVVGLEVLRGGQVAVELTVHAVSSTSAFCHGLFRSLSVGLNASEAAAAASGGVVTGRHAPARVSWQQGRLSVGAAPMIDMQISGEAAEVEADAERGPNQMKCSSSSMSGGGLLGLGAAGFAPDAAEGLGSFSPDFVLAARAAMELERSPSDAVHTGERLSTEPAALSGCLSGPLDSNVSELYERGCQIAEAIQDIDESGCFRAPGQDSDAADRPQSAAEGIAELKRLLAHDCFTAATQQGDHVDSSAVFNETQLSQAVQERYSEIIASYEDVHLTKHEIRSLKRFLTTTMEDIMAKVDTPSASLASIDSEDAADAENSGLAVSSGTRDKFLAYRTQVDLVSNTLQQFEAQDVRFRHTLAESVSMQEQLAVALAHRSRLSQNLAEQLEEASPNAEQATRTRDMLLSQVLSFDPSQQLAPLHGDIKDLMAEFRQVDRPLASLIDPMDGANTLGDDRNPLYVKEQLEEFVSLMSRQREALSNDLEGAGGSMRATLSAVYSHVVELLRFFQEHGYYPPQAISVIVNKTAQHASMEQQAEVAAADAAVQLPVDLDRYGMQGGHRRRSTATWIEEAAQYGWPSSSSAMDTPGSPPAATGGDSYLNRSTQGILTDSSNTSVPPSSASPAWAGITRPSSHPSASADTPLTAPNLVRSASGAQSPLPELQFPPSGLQDAPTPSLSFASGGQASTPPMPGSGLQSMPASDSPTRQPQSWPLFPAAAVAPPQPHDAQLQLQPATEFYTPHGRDPSGFHAQFANLSEHSAEAAAEAPQGPSPTISPLLFGARAHSAERGGSVGSEPLLEVAPGPGSSLDSDLTSPCTATHSAAPTQASPPSAAGAAPSQPASVTFTAPNSNVRVPALPLPSQSPLPALNFNVSPAGAHAPLTDELRSPQRPFATAAAADGGSTGAGRPSPMFNAGSSAASQATAAPAFGTASGPFTFAAPPPSSGPFQFSVGGPAPAASVPGATSGVASPGFMFSAGPPAPVPPASMPKSASPGFRFGAEPAEAATGSAPSSPTSLRFSAAELSVGTASGLPRHRPGSAHPRWSDSSSGFLGSRLPRAPSLSGTAPRSGQSSRRSSVDLGQQEPTPVPMPTLTSPAPSSLPSGPSTAPPPGAMSFPPSSAPFSASAIPAESSAESSALPSMPETLLPLALPEAEEEIVRKFPGFSPVKSPAEPDTGLEKHRPRRSPSPEEALRTGITLPPGTWHAAQTGNGRASPPQQAPLAPQISVDPDASAHDVMHEEASSSGPPLSPLSPLNPLGDCMFPSAAPQDTGSNCGVQGGRDDVGIDTETPREVTQDRSVSDLSSLPQEGSSTSPSPMGAGEPHGGGSVSPAGGAAPKQRWSGVYGNGLFQYSSPIGNGSASPEPGSTSVEASPEPQRVKAFGHDARAAARMSPDENSCENLPARAAGQQQLSL